MPNRNALLAVAAFAALAACNSNYNINDLYGSATATPTATPTPTANPALTSATVTVTVSGSPIPSQVVNLYPSTTTGQQSSTTPIATASTTANGEAIFNSLTGGQWYCFGTTYTPSGSLAQTKSDCTNLWGTFGVQLAF